MPTRAKRRCPRCRRGYSGPVCERCKARDETIREKHDDGAGEFYQTPEWRRISAHFLKHHPLCVLCEAEGKSVPAKVADHYPTSRRDLLAQGIVYPDAWRRLRPLCLGHHRTETNRLQPGGFIAHPERY